MSDPQPNLPEGFRYAGLACGMKPSGKPDVALIVADRPVVAAGVYTQNQVVAAPVVLSKSRTPSRSVRAVVANSGNANACTGETGMQDAREMCRQVARQVGCEENDVLVMSTGVIGQALPMQQVCSGIEQAGAKLNDTVGAFEDVADAILTTDLGRKVALRELELDGRPVRLAAMAKGAGMVAPNMATLLSVVLTDAALSPDDAQRLLREAAEVSFNRVSVDGHTSTNDTLLLLASGQGEPLQGDDLKALGRELQEVTVELAKELVADGEGAKHYMQLHVRGAEDDAAAKKIAETVAASPLVKTAITGADPNWGRIVSAAGYAPAKVAPERLTLKICDRTIYENGHPVEYDAAMVSYDMKQQREVPLELIVGDGPGRVTFWASDLTTDYVTFNSKYTT